MASEEMMRAEFERRMALFPPDRYQNNHSWRVRTSESLREHMQHVVTVPRSDEREFTRGIPLASQTIDWLLDNIGPEGMTGYNSTQMGTFQWKVGGWDWLWSFEQVNEGVDILFLDPNDAVAFKVRWA